LDKINRSGISSVLEVTTRYRWLPRKAKDGIRITNAEPFAADRTSTNGNIWGSTWTSPRARLTKKKIIDEKTMEYWSIMVVAR